MAEEKYVVRVSLFQIILWIGDVVARRVNIKDLSSCGPGSKARAVLDAEVCIYTHPSVCTHRVMTQL